MLDIPPFDQEEFKKAESAFNEGKYKRAAEILSNFSGVGSRRGNKEALLTSIEVSLRALHGKLSDDDGYHDRIKWLLGRVLWEQHSDLAEALGFFEGVHEGISEQDDEDNKDARMRACYCYAKLLIFVEQYKDCDNVVGKLFKHAKGMAWFLSANKDDIASAVFENRKYNRFLYKYEFEYLFSKEFFQDLLYETDETDGTDLSNVYRLARALFKYESKRREGFFSEMFSGVDPILRTIVRCLPIILKDSGRVLNNEERKILLYELPYYGGVYLLSESRSSQLEGVKILLQWMKQELPNSYDTRRANAMKKIRNVLLVDFLNEKSVKVLKEFFADPDSQKYLLSESRSNLRYLFGLALYRSKKYIQSIDVFSDLLVNEDNRDWLDRPGESNRADALRYLGQAFSKSERYADAVDVFKELTKLTRSNYDKERLSDALKKANPGTGNLVDDMRAKAREDLLRTGGSINRPGWLEKYRSSIENKERDNPTDSLS